MTIFVNFADVTEVRNGCVHVGDHRWRQQMTAATRVVQFNGSVASLIFTMLSLSRHISSRCLCYSNWPQSRVSRSWSADNIIKNWTR